MKNPIWVLLILVFLASTVAIASAARCSYTEPGARSICDQLEGMGFDVTGTDVLAVDYVHPAIDMAKDYQIDATDSRGDEFIGTVTTLSQFNESAKLFEDLRTQNCSQIKMDINVGVVSAVFDGTKVVGGNGTFYFVSNQITKMTREAGGADDSILEKQLPVGFGTSRGNSDRGAKWETVEVCSPLFSINDINDTEKTALNGQLAQARINLRF